MIGRLVTVQDLADQTGIPDWKIRKAIRQGKLPAREDGRRHWVLEQDAAAWINSWRPASALATPSRVLAEPAKAAS